MVKKELFKIHESEFDWVLREKSRDHKEEFIKFFKSFFAQKSPWKIRILKFFSRTLKFSCRITFFKSFPAKILRNSPEFFWEDFKKKWIKVSGKTFFPLLFNFFHFYILLELLAKAWTLYYFRNLLNTVYVCCEQIWGKNDFVLSFSW